MLDIDDPARYQLIDLETGKEVNPAMFIQRVKNGGWEKAYAETLAKYIECGDGQAVTFLAFLIKTKDNKNMVYGSQRELAKRCKIGLSAVNATIKALERKKLLRRIRSCCYMLTPRMITNGNANMGAIIYRIWMGEQ